MSEEPKSPPNAHGIRSMIKYEVLLKHSLDKGYKNFRKAMGDDVIDYEEYQFWYYRFYQGDMDVTYDRSTYPKQPTLNELPNEMLAEMMSKLDVKSRMRSRLVCQRMSDVHPHVSKKLKKISVHVEESRNCLKFDTNEVTYYKSVSGCTIMDLYRKPFVYKTFKDNYVTKAMETLKLVLEGPKIEIKKFFVFIDTVTGTEEVLRTLQKIRGEPKCRELEVESASIRTKDLEATVSMLALLKPRTLEKIELLSCDPLTAMNISRLQAMPQFENSKEINMKLFAVIDADLIFIHFRHFEVFNIVVHSMSTKQLYRLRSMLSITDSIHFKSCLIRMLNPLHREFDEIRKALGELGLVDDDCRTSIRYHHIIPNTGGAYLDFEIRSNEIEVTRHAKPQKNEKLRLR